MLVDLLDLLDLLGRLVVAGAFGVAAVLKLADLPGLRATLYLSRLTRPWVPQLSVALPATELGLAAVLVTTRGAWAGALASAVLLVAFTLYLALDRSAGQGCNCFGRRSRSSRRGGILRDVVLLAALLPVLVRGPGAARPGVPEPVEPWFVAAAALAIVAGIALAFRRGPSRRGRRRTGVPPAPPRQVRREAVPFELPALDGGRIRLADLLPAGPLLLFVEAGCDRCELVLPEVADRPAVVVIAAGPPSDVAELAARHGLAPHRVAVDEDGAVADAYRLPATPGACRLTPDGVLVGADGLPVQRLAVGLDDVRALLAPAPRT